MTAPEPILRPAARVLLIDGRDRLLLFRGRDPGEPQAPAFWATVGGGLEPGETPEQGALREMHEETGLLLAAEELVGPVWEEVAEFPFEGQNYRQPQMFFVARVATCQVDTSAFSEVEQRSIDGHRWWTLDELDATDDIYYPHDLPRLLRRVLLAQEVV